MFLRACDLVVLCFIIRHCISSCAISAFSCAILFLQLLALFEPVLWVGIPTRRIRTYLYLPSHFTSQFCCQVVRKPFFISAKYHPWERRNLKWAKTYFQVSLCFLCPGLCCVQHGTQWASLGCVWCSCAHQKVTCSPRTCPTLTCGRGELQDTAQGSCCPKCVGPGGEYCLVPSEPPFSPTSARLFFCCSVLLGRYWGQACLIIPFLSCCHVYVSNGFTHGPRGGDKL